MTPSAVQRIKQNRVRAETKRAVSRLFQHSMNEMSMARRDKMRRSRCILKLKCIKLLGWIWQVTIQMDSKTYGLSNLVDIGKVFNTVYGEEVTV